MTAEGMVIARRSAWLPHAVLILGIAVVLFPIYVALVAASDQLSDILEAPMSLMPGIRLVPNFAEALTAGTAKTSGQPVSAMLFNSLVMALVIAAGKIAISLPSAYAVVFFRFRSEEHTSELQSLTNLVCRLLLEKKKTSSSKRSPT